MNNRIKAGLLGILGLIAFESSCSGNKADTSNYIFNESRYRIYQEKMDNESRFDVASKSLLFAVPMILFGELYRKKYTSK